MRAILRLAELQHERPCVDHIERRELGAALEEVFAMTVNNIMPVARLAVFDEVRHELRDELDHATRGVKRTYEARMQVKAQLAGVETAETEPAVTSEPVTRADVEKLAVTIYSVIQKEVLAISYRPGLEAVRDTLDGEAVEAMERCRETLERLLTVRGGEDSEAISWETE